MTEKTIPTVVDTTEEEFHASEDSLVVNCDPCKFDNTETEADGYCYDCNEYLCKQCLQSHRKFRAFRDHNILVGDAVPKCKAENSERLAFKQCDDHRMNEVLFYCCDHKSVFCSLCKAAKHSTCDCKPIQDICKTDGRTNFDQAAKDIESIKKEFEKLKTSDIEKIDAIKGVSHTCKVQLNSMRKQMSDFFEMLEQEIDSAEIQHGSSITDLRENVAIYTDAVNHISSLSEYIQQVSKSDDETAVFAAEAKLKKLHAEYLIVKETFHFKVEKKGPRQPYETITVVQEMCNNICEKMALKKLKKAENSAADTIGNTNTAGLHVCGLENMADKNLMPPTSPASSKSDFSKSTEASNRCFKNLKIKQKFLVSMKTEEEGPSCNITDSVFLSNRNLVLCDYVNSSVLLLDKDFKPVDKLELVTRPWGVALINANKIIVTLPDEKKLRYITIESKKLCQAGSISLKGVCWGICRCKGNVIITFRDPGKTYIEIRKLDGEKVETILLQHDDTMSHFYVTAHQNQSNACIYFSDGKSAIFCYTLDGQFLCKFQNDAIKLPRQMIIADNGDCIVSSQFGKKLVLLTDNLSSAQDLWKDSDIFKTWMKQSRLPQTMSMRWEDLTLIVGHDSKNQIQVIKMYKTI